MRKQLLVLSLAVVMAVSLSGCGAKSADVTTTAQAPSTLMQSKYDKVEIKQASKVDQMSQPEKGETIVVMTIKDMGDIKIKFFNQDSPKAVENFVTLAKNGYYDGITFHRVIKDFMIQGGDPTGTGAGGESMWGEEFVNEFSDTLLPLKGSLCMARTNQFDTNGSQFFIVQNEKVAQADLDDLKAQGLELTKEQESAFIEFGGYPFLTGQYTVFGQVYEGLDIVDQIASQEVDGSDKPTTDVIIDKIEVTEFN